MKTSNLPSIYCQRFPSAVLLSALLLLTCAGSAAEVPVAALPGVAPYPPELSQRLAAAVESFGSGYRPRTRHLEADGSARYTNRLALEASPYLRQHAHNPVNWYAWGDEPFAVARQKGVPVLLSIGYSTCHWCHVMEEESFEDEEIARVLNESYVAIKVDREERPDLDTIYMTSVQALTGRGGWPMTVWLDHDRKPFFGGTYFPARDGDRGAASGFLSLLVRLRQIYDEDPARVREAATQLAQIIAERLAPAATTAADLPGSEVLKQAVDFYRGRFDGLYGGVGKGNKFPSSLPSRLLLRYYRRSGDERALDMAKRTLEKMAAGGMYDQVGGGFHRYSTDPRWLVPHFEKMLYDNALLVPVYLEAWQVTGDERFAEVARDLLRYVERDMTSPEGAFYSATDADSLTPSGHREEGYFFTWTPAELSAALGEERARIIGAVFGVSAAGNFEGRNILHLPKPISEVARSLEMEPAALREMIEEARQTLYRKRRKRPAPLRDEKILTGWNSLMISAYAQAALVLGDPHYATIARRAADFLLREMRRDGCWLRVFKDGAAHQPAFLDDHAFLTAALLDLFEATGEKKWLDEAIAVDRVLEQSFEDRESGGFFFTSSTNSEKLLAREKPNHDDAEPSGNSIALMNLLRLHQLTLREAYQQRAERTLGAFAAQLRQFPASLSEMLLAVDFHLDTAKEIVLLAPRSRAQAEPLLGVLRRTFVPNRALAVIVQEQTATLAERVPWVDGKVAKGGKATAYVCKQQICDLPTSDPAVFARQLAEVEPFVWQDAKDEDTPIDLFP